MEIKKKMEDQKKLYVFEVEKAKEVRSNGRPSRGPVYRNVLAKDGFRPLSQSLQSCWDIFWSVHLHHHTMHPKNI